MKQYFFLIAAAGISLSCFAKINIQQKSQVNKIVGRNKNIGIAILRKEFDQIVKKKVLEMNQGKHFKTEEFITLIRIDNTIGMNEMTQESPENKKFCALFLSKYSEKAIYKLHAKLDLGMSYYSKKYNVYWGGIPHYNSIFRIIKPNRKIKN